MAKPHRPPFTISPTVLTTVGEIMRLVGQYEGISEPPPAPKLRRQNRIRTVVGSLAIEGNTLTLDQVTALLGDKRVVGSKREIHARQAAYYRVLGECDAAGDSTRFVEFALTALHDSLAELVGALRPAPLTSESRLEIAAGHFGRDEFSRKDYLAHFKRISTATASRDLREGVEGGRLIRKGDRALARYRFR